MQYAERDVNWVCYLCRRWLPAGRPLVEISYYINEEYEGCQRCNIPNPRWLLTWMASILQCDVPVIEAIYYNAIDARPTYIAKSICKW